MGAPLLILNTGIMKSLEKNGEWQVSEVELVYRSSRGIEASPKVTSSKEVYNVFLAHWDMQKIEFVEQAKIMMLNRSNKVIGIYDLASGGLDFVAIDIRMIFCCALLTKASAVIFAHNHPSGKLYPSEEDLRMTRKIKEAGKLIEIPLLDSVIVTLNGYVSLSDKGLM